MDSRYVEQAELYLPLAFRALGSQFATFDNCREYYEKLGNDRVRNDFLRIASFYLYLVKIGNWYIKDGDNESVVDYLDESYKTVTLFSLVEATGKEDYQGFFDWLAKQKQFPITDANHLTAMHEEYLNTYGSIRRCLQFFRLLSSSRKEQLCAGVQLNGSATQRIEELARFLYELRSKFVHEGRLILELNQSLVVSKVGKKVAATTVSLAELMAAFEEGLVAVMGARH